LNTYTLTVARSGVGTGSVTSSPVGITCGADCTQVYTHGTVITLTATPARGSSFASWTNCPSASLNVCTVTLTAARTVTARFNGPSSIAITSPASGSSFFYTGYDNALGLWYYDITLVGSAVDSEDGPLTGSSLVWTTNLTALQPALLGTGGTLTTRIYSNDCFGVTHRITLTATDSDGNTRSVFIDVGIYTIC